ncbi:MAG: two-component system response regulator [Clostridium sp. 26_21]|nr:MAG: two-component system response regulator [Clostridium sp. 26_21]CDE54676.1 response regulators consisting of a CheY-like receiver domain and a winged-helix DNA-binding domain [Clostridium sp. CAG:269]
MKILLVEDNEILAKGLIYSLEQKKYQVIHTLNVENTLKILKTEKIDLAILDVSLPDGNGFDLYRNNIKEKNISSIFLTAKDEEDNIVKGLELGAEDYITKPFSIKELMARINRIILRNKKNTIIQVQNIKFDMDKMVVYRDNENVELTNLELKILNLLFLNLNKVVKRSEIIDKIWEWTGNDVNDNTVTVYLKRIREKIKTDIIITIKGIGYRIDSEVD